MKRHLLPLLRKRRKNPRRKRNQLRLRPRRVRAHRPLQPLQTLHPRPRLRHPPSHLTLRLQRRVRQVRPLVLQSQRPQRRSLRRSLRRSQLRRGRHSVVQRRLSMRSGRRHRYLCLRSRPHSLHTSTSRRRASRVESQRSRRAPRWATWEPCRRPRRSFTARSRRRRRRMRTATLKVTATKRERAPGLA